MGKPRLKLYIISHILWDREGVHTFQELRLHLVQFLDNILSTLAAIPSLDGFVLDGQSIFIEDYLEIRPELRELVTRLNQNGQIHLGPWYILPNEFLCSPEALIRNLQLGSETALRLGARLNVGHLSSTIAHIGQMPQILHGFGIEIATIVDNIQSDTPLEQWWFAPDGSRVLLIHLCEEPGLTLSDNTETFSTTLTQIKNKLKKRTAAQALAILSDIKHQETGHIAHLVDNIQGQLRGIQVVHGDLNGYLAEVSNTVKKLSTTEGDIQLLPFSAGAFSARTWIKQHNHILEILLEHWAEPFSAWVSLSENTTDNRWLQKPDDLVTHAWRLLLPNHAITSISGCAIDQVHREMQIRFEQAEQIGAEIVEQNLQHLASKIDTSLISSDGNALYVLVFNGAGHPQTGLVSIEIPSSNQPLTVLETSGRPRPTECTSVPEDSRLCYVRFTAENVPSYGFRTYLLQPNTGNAPDVQIDDIPTIENEYLSVSVDLFNGTFTLFDKYTGRSFPELNRYIDGGDCGNPAAYQPPHRDTLIDIATNTPLHVDRRISSTQQEISYLQIYRLPQMLTPQRDARLPLAAQFVPISITTSLKLTPGVPRLDVEVQVTNNALDHRLRAHFPTGIRTSEVLFDGHFEVVSRSVPGNYPQQAFVTVPGIDTGLTIANQGLTEAAALTSSEGVEVALTLMRSVGRLRPPNTPDDIQIPDAQCRGNYHFSYSLIPHAQDPLPAWQQAWAFQNPLRAVVTNSHPGTMAMEESLALVDNPAFVLSTVKTATTKRGLIVRGYCISKKTEKVVLKLGIPARQAEIARLDESPIGKRIKPDSHGCYHFEVNPAEIVTLLFKID
ncbi:MAG: hypothetical protein JXB07_15085 [Anaerolineae bacterium]|nr:hypothetical protein [Anaerolineae bacterium]